MKTNNTNQFRYRLLFGAANGHHYHFGGYETMQQAKQAAKLFLYGQGTIPAWVQVEDTLTGAKGKIYTSHKNK